MLDGDRARPCVLQQHDHHDHRPSGQHAVVGDLGRLRFPRLAQEHAVRRAGRRREGRRRRAGTRREERRSARQGPGPGRESAVRALNACGLKITQHLRRDADPAQRLPSAEEASRLIRLKEREHMARYLGPKCKLSRREGTDLFLKSGVKPLESRSASWRCRRAASRASAARACPTTACSCARSRSCAACTACSSASSATTTRKASRRTGRDRRDPAAAAGVAARQRRLPHGLRVDAHRSAPAGEPQGDPGEWRGGERSPRTRCKAGDTVQVREKARKQLRIQSAIAVKAQVGFPDWVEVDEKKFRGTFKSAAGARRHAAGHQREPGRRVVFEVIRWRFDAIFCDRILEAPASSRCSPSHRVRRVS